jgi:hypothetical protein
MAEATSALSTERPTGTWRTPLTTIELHRMAITNLVTKSARFMPAACPLTDRYMSPMSLSLPEVRPDVALLLPYVCTIDFTQTLQLTCMCHSAGAAEDARSNALVTQEMAQDVRRAEALA